MPPRAFPQVEARDDAELLLNVIRSSPDDPRNYLVLADHLQQLGDPRGHLIALQASLLRRGPYFVEQSVRELLQAHAEELLGPHTSQLGLDWFLGFVARARVSCEAPQTSIDAVRALFAGHPSFSLLREVVLERDEGRASVEAAVDELARVEGSPLSVLRIRGGDHAWQRSLGDVGTLWSVFRQLRVVDLHGYTLHFGELDLPELCSFAIHTGTAAGRLAVSRIFEGACPSLRHLTIDISLDDDFDGAPIEMPSELAAGLPNLRHLVFRAPDTDAFWQRLANDRLLSQLSTLDTSLDNLGAEILQDYAPRFQHLEKMLLRGNRILEPGVPARLAALLPRAQIY
jgi:uncharacterized protein (TIGR02996 family)